MKEIVFKVDLVLLGALIAVAIPIINLLLEILKAERHAALARASIFEKIGFMERRLDNIDNWIAKNSGLLHPRN
jgi:hypothetical protein